MQLMVKKSDGSKEIYLHTKVMGTIACALSKAESHQFAFADHLAEAVTTYLRSQDSDCLSVDEIHGMIQAVLTDTKCEDAAMALHDHRIMRQVNRNRIEVIKYETQSDLRIHTIPLRYRQPAAIRSSQPWNKSVIVQELMTERESTRDLARAIAGAVEEKVLRLQCQSLPSTLVQELVNNDWWVMQEAEQALAQQQIPEVQDRVAAVC